MWSDAEGHRGAGLSGGKNGFCYRGAPGSAVTVTTVTPPPFDVAAEFLLAGRRALDSGWFRGVTNTRGTALDLSAAATLRND